MLKDRVNIFVILILILAAVLRLWNLADFPAGFNADEAAIGYNAYSLIETGKDEYGAGFPLVFKSFGDFKPGLYFYFVLPFIKLLGLSEWAVRIPSALLGIGTVYLIFSLGRKIFQNSAVGLVSAFLLAISPWHLHFSRGGWESNAATFFIALGVYFFVRAMEESKYLFWSLLAFLFSMYIYQSPRLIVPVFLLGLTFMYRQKLWAAVKGNLKVIGLLAILSIPLILQFTSGGGSARFSGLSFLSDPGPQSRVNELRGEHDDPNSKIPKLVHNKVTAYAPVFLGHYLDHFKPDFLFINGDEVIRNKVPESGQFYLIESIFLILGAVFLVRNPFKYSRILVLWILTAPLASSMTFQTPNALRSLSMVVPMTLVAGIGLLSIWNLVKGKGRYLIISAVAIFLLFEFVHYMESYYVHYPKRYPLAWEYGFKEMTGKLMVQQSLYEKVVITDRYDQPYILTLFYSKYDPAKYQPQANLTPRDKFNFGTIRSFDKYEFRFIDPKEAGQPGVLYIGTANEVPEGAKIFDSVKFPGGDAGFVFSKI